MSEELNYEDYIGKRVKIKHISKKSYRNNGVINGLCGVVERVSSTQIGVLIDAFYNKSRSYGVYWFRRDELEIVENESEEKKMTGFNKVAIVNLLDDYNKKDYGFALYDSEWVLMEYGEHEVKPNTLVVVNARNKDNRILGIVKDIVSIEEYNKGVTAQVLGVVNMDGYYARVNEENRLKELAKKKAAIEKELEAEINKRKSVEYYEEMANKYSDNPRLKELVDELKILEV